MDHDSNINVWSLKIGSKVKIKTKLGDEYIGKTFSNDPLTNLVVLQEPSSGGKRNLRIINANFIESVTHLNNNNNNYIKHAEQKDNSNGSSQSKEKAEGLNTPASLDEEELIQITKISWSKIRQREAEAIQRGEESLLKIGRGVSVEAQLLFNEIDQARLPVRWEESSIIVLDNIRVNAPYTAESCVALNATGERSLPRVQKIIEEARKKIERTAKK
jgi:small nuclear ribonucleoprotein (snRNP)-like protein